MSVFKRLRTTLATYVPGLGAAESDDGLDPPPGDDDVYKRFGNKSIGVWCPDLGMAKLLRTRGKQLRTMGVSIDGSVCLFGEEALYLCERALLVLLPGEDAAEPLHAREVYGVCVAGAPAAPAGEAPAAAPAGAAPAPAAAAPHARRARSTATGSTRTSGAWATRRSAATRRPGPTAATRRRRRSGAPGTRPPPVAWEVHQPPAQFSKRRLPPPSFLVFVALYGGALPPSPTCRRSSRPARPRPSRRRRRRRGTVLIFEMKAGVPDADAQ
ncbi:hypothetical protein JL722_11143 [Aureococcus anophagefferens]|nr:hypothetical protein JL722_11143 [Aureococcus anophagefferens]